MIDTIILSEINADDAKSTFKLWLNDKFTLLVVLGTQEEARLALQAAYKQINSGSVNYKSVRAIHAPVPEFIVPELKQLKVNPALNPINWANIGLYAILSLSNKYNNIGKIYSNIDITENTEGKINNLVLQAQAFDRP